MLDEWKMLFIYDDVCVRGGPNQPLHRDLQFIYDDAGVHSSSKNNNWTTENVRLSSCSS
jgi:hypothetical protein